MSANPHEHGTFYAILSASKRIRTDLMRSNPRLRVFALFSMFANGNPLSIRGLPFAKSAIRVCFEERVWFLMVWSVFDGWAPMGRNPLCIKGKRILGSPARSIRPFACPPVRSAYVRRCLRPRTAETSARSMLRR